jgi:hypothetical protein
MGTSSASCDDAAVSCDWRLCIHQKLRWEEDTGRTLSIFYMTLRIHESILEDLCGILLSEILQIKNLARDWIRVCAKGALEVLETVVEIGRLEEGQDKRRGGDLKGVLRVQG